MKEIYFDNAATTPVREEVFVEMNRYFSEEYGNPSSIYNLAKNAKKAVEHAREQVAAILCAESKEIYFTSSGTESDNWAIKGISEAYSSKGKHIITQQTEHHAVLHTCEYLQKKGYEVTYLSVDSDGFVVIDELKKAIRNDTILISIMAANNEIGVIQPLKEIGKIAKEHGILFHTDAVQAVGRIPLNVNEFNIDLLSLSSHKNYGPKGVGALYVKKGVKLPPLLHGGSQERNHRAGTENVPGIVGFGKAVELISAEMEEENKKLTEIRDKIINEILSAIPHCRLNGSRNNRLPGNINISFEYIEGESILLLLGHSHKIAASSGSACTSGSLDPSHVLLAIGLDHATSHGSLRISLGKYNTMEEADILLEALPSVIHKLREISPLYNGN